MERDLSHKKPAQQLPATPTGESLDGGRSAVARMRDVVLPTPEDGRKILHSDLGRVETLAQDFRANPAKALAVLAGLPDGSWNFSVYENIGWPAPNPEEALAAALAVISTRKADSVEPLRFAAGRERVNWNLGTPDRQVVASHLLEGGEERPEAFFLQIHTPSMGEKAADMVEALLARKIAEGGLDVSSYLGEDFCQVLSDDHGHRINFDTLDHFGLLEGLEPEALDALEEYEHLGELTDTSLDSINDMEAVRQSDGCFHFDEGALVWSKTESEG